MEKIKNTTCALCLLVLLSVALAAPAQTAHWITADDPLCNEPNTWIQFCKAFTLKKKPKRGEARIAADSKYWLWVNGRMAVFEGGLKRGPNPADTYYDVVDLAPYLQKGQNDVRLLLCYFGKQGFSHVSSGQSGIIVHAPSIGLATDASWQSQRLKAYQTCGEPYTNFRLAESNIRYEAPQSSKFNVQSSKLQAFAGNRCVGFCSLGQAGETAYSSVARLRHEDCHKGRYNYSSPLGGRRGGFCGTLRKAAL